MTTTSERKRVADETRAKYQKQHENYVTDPVIFKRFYNSVIDPRYFHLNKSHFQDAHILDAGCGNSTYFQCAMLDLGVKRITCLELGEEWKESLRQGLIYHGYENQLHKIEFVTGSTTELPFEDNMFDMVFSNGVLMHLTDWNEINEAQKELCRVTKPKGYLYEVLGVNGGLIDELTETTRAYIRKHKEYSDIIENLTAKDVQEYFNVTNEIRLINGDSPLPVDLILKAFDTDYTTFLQNVLLVPKQHQSRLTMDWATTTLVENGFEKPKRCKRYVKRSNIRTLFSALHYILGGLNLRQGKDIDKTKMLAKMLYGEGNVEVISRKK